MTTRGRARPPPRTMDDLSFYTLTADLLTALVAAELSALVGFLDAPATPTPRAAVGICWSYVVVG